jgi:probable addiction module antidote protein
MPVKIAKWNPADYLKTSEDIAGYLEVALEDGDPEMLKVALGNIARFKGMTEVAEKAGIARQSLYRALSAKGNPELATVASILKVLGLRLSVVSTSKRQAARPRTGAKGRSRAAA